MTDGKPPDERLPIELSADEAEEFAKEGIAPNDLKQRERGMFNHSDRTHLLGLKEYKHHQAASNADRRVRHRIQHTIRDFCFLPLLDEDELEKVFSGTPRGDNGLDDNVVHQSLSQLIAFVYAGMDMAPADLEPIIENGVLAGETRDNNQPGLWGQYTGGIQAVNVDIDPVYNPDAEEIAERFEKHGSSSLTSAEIGVLARSGRLDEEDLNEIARAGWGAADNGN